MKQRPGWRTLAALLAIVALVGGACGNDDDDTAATGTGTGTETGTGAGTDDGATAEGFCEGYLAVLAGDATTPEQIRALIPDAPEAAKEPLEAVASGLEAQGEAFFETEEFGESFAAIQGPVNEECAEQTIDVNMVDFGYEGIPSEIPAGIIGANVANTGQEFHEMIVFKRNEGVEQSFDEIFAASEEEAEALVTQAGAAFAEPGGSSSTLLPLTEPGDYVAICFIPEGSTPDAEEGSGPPHFTLGMKTEFTVT